MHASSADRLHSFVKQASIAAGSDVVVVDGASGLHAPLLVPRSWAGAANSTPTPLPTTTGGPSTAHIACLLAAPCLLIVDGRAANSVADILQVVQHCANTPSTGTTSSAGKSRGQPFLRIGLLLVNRVAAADAATIASQLPAALLAAGLGHVRLAGVVPDFGIGMGADLPALMCKHIDMGGVQRGAAPLPPLTSCAATSPRTHRNLLAAFAGVVARGRGGSGKQHHHNHHQPQAAATLQSPLQEARATSQQQQQVVVAVAHDTIFQTCYPG